MSLARLAGYTERRCIVRGDLGFYGSVVTFGRYAFQAGSVRQKIPRDDIIKALKTCIYRHAALRTIVLDAQTEQPKLAPVESLDLDCHLKTLEPSTCETDSVQRLLEHVHNDALPEAHIRPQWRVYVAACRATRDLPTADEGFLLAFAYSHSLLDGRSGFLFHHSLLEALRTSDTSTYDTEAVWRVPSGADPLHLPLNLAANFTVSWRFLLSPLLNQYLPKSLLTVLGLRPSKAENAWVGATIRPKAPTSNQLVKTAVKVTSIPGDITDRVLRVCRSHNTRLTGLLNLFLARAVGRALRRRGQSHTTFTTKFPIDMRRALGPEYRGILANYASAVSEPVTVAPGELDDPYQMSVGDWATVQQTTEHLGAASQRLSDQVVALLKYLPDYRKWTLDQSVIRPNGSYEISNLGLFDPISIRPNENRWVIENFGFSQSAGAISDPLSVNVASTKGGPLLLAFTWWPGMLDVTDEGTFVEELGADVAGMMNSIAESD